jgi:hypothetical protein
VRSRGSRRSRGGLNYSSFMGCCCRRLGFFRRAGGQGHHGDDGDHKSEHDQFFHKLNSFFKEQFVGSRFDRCIKGQNSDLNFDPGSLSFDFGTSPFRFQNFSLEGGWSPRFSSAHFFAKRDFVRAPFLLSVFDGIEQALARQLAILCLRSGILHGYADSTRPMPQCYSGRHLVHILTTRPG